MLDSSTSLQVQKRRYTAEDLFEVVVDSVVGIKTEDGSGSGVIIEPNGVIATNSHVVSNCPNVIIFFKNNVKMKGKVIRAYKNIDLSFVQIQSEQFFSHQKFFKNRVKAGESVLAIGHPFGLEYTLTRGIVSSPERNINGTKYLQVDASINPGNSGGPLYSLYAELLGISTMSLSGSQGLNFAIPAKIIAEKYEELLDELKNGLIHYCHTCGHNSRNDRYCEFCGSYLENDAIDFTSAPSVPQSTEQVASQSCHSCGTMVNSIEKYCPVCGSTLKN